LEYHGILTPGQHGLRPGFSSETLNLLSYKKKRFQAGLEEIMIFFKSKNQIFLI